MKDDLALVNLAIAYIEDHLKEKVSLEDMAKAVGFSKFYFTRLFTKYANQSPYDYYRGRKITETIYYLMDTKCKIIDAAYEYGYSSPEVFARACASVFGKSPSAVRKSIMDGSFRGINPIDEGYLWFINVYKCKPHVKGMEALELAGIGYFADDIQDSLYHMKQEALKTMQQNGGPYFKLSWLEKQPMGYMNFIGQGITKGIENDALLTKSIPKMIYLIFDYNLDKDHLPYFYQYIFDTYIPSSPYELIAPYCLEIMTQEKGHRDSRMYIPVLPKEVQRKS